MLYSNYGNLRCFIYYNFAVKFYTLGWKKFEPVHEISVLITVEPSQISCLTRAFTAVLHKEGLKPKFRALTWFDSCACTVEEWIYICHKTTNLMNRLICVLFNSVNLYLADIFLLKMSFAFYFCCVIRLIMGANTMNLDQTASWEQSDLGPYCLQYRLPKKICRWESRW